MYPKLYNSSGQVLAVLDNIIKETASIKRVVNGEFTFAFEAYEKELKSEYFNPDNNIVVDDQTFDIKYIEQNHETDVKYSIQCEHVNYRLEDGDENLYSTYAYTGTPKQILTNILSGTEFNVGTVEFTDVITISVNQEITRKKLIYQLANLLGGEIDYTDQGFTINILNTIGQNNGFQVKFGKNLKGITKIIDSRGGGVKTYYKVNILELKNSNEYIEKGFRDLEVIGVGDTINIIDQVIGLDVQNRVLSKEYNPIFELNTILEITNTIDLITDKINQIETESVKLNKAYNNVIIDPEYGFRATLSDGSGRATLGGGGISLDTGDGEGGYTPAMFLNPITKKYKYIGDVEVEGTITITAGSGIGNLSDAGALATLDSIDETHITDGAITTPKLAAGAVDASKIAAGAVVASKISVDSLSAISANLGDIYVDETHITDGAITTPKLAAGAVDASKISVDSLSAISANLGTVYAGTLNSVYINTQEDINIGNNLYLGSQDDPSPKSIFFYSAGGNICSIGQLVGNQLCIASFGSILLAVPTTDEFNFIQLYANRVLLPSDTYCGGTGYESLVARLSDTAVYAGTGLSGGGSSGPVSLSVDFTKVPKTTSGQQIEFQSFGGRLEWRLKGGKFKALANLEDINK